MANWAKSEQSDNDELVSTTARFLIRNAPSLFLGAEAKRVLFFAKRVFMKTPELDALFLPYLEESFKQARTQIKQNLEILNLPMLPEDADALIFDKLQLRYHIGTHFHSSLYAATREIVARLLALDQQIEIQLKNSAKVDIEALRT